MSRDWRKEDEIAHGEAHDGTLRGKIDFYTKSLAAYLLINVLAIQVLCTIRLPVRQLRHLGPDAWKVLTPMVVFGVCCYAWGYRHRPKLVALVVSAALIATSGMAFVGYRINPRRSSSSSSSLTERVPRISPDTNVQSPWFRPFDLYLGEFPENIEGLTFFIEGDFTNDEFQAIGDWLKDKVPSSRGAVLQDLPKPGTQRPQPTVARLTIGPIKNSKQLLASINFADVIPDGSNTVRLKPRRPLSLGTNPSGNRAAYFLGELRSNDSKRQLAAAKELESTQPFEARGEISSKLFQLAREPGRFRDFYPAWSRWATANEVDGILLWLEDIAAKPFNIPPNQDDQLRMEQRRLLFQTLAHVAPDNAALWFCEFVINDTNYTQEVAIMDFGGILAEASESHLVQLLENSTPAIPIAACLGLRMKGTKTSLPALEAATTSSDPKLVTEAKKAIDAIKFRRK